MAIYYTPVARRLSERGRALIPVAGVLHLRPTPDSSRRPWGSSSLLASRCGSRSWLVYTYKYMRCIHSTRCIYIYNIQAAVVGMAMVNVVLSSLAPAATKEGEATKEEESEEATKEEEEKETYLEQLRDSLMQLLTGVDGGKQDTPGRSLANVGWAIFALITLTAYTVRPSR